MIENTVPLFPEINLSVTEQHIVAQKLSDSTVKKYLKKLGYDIAVQLVIHNEPADGESAEKFLRRRMNLQGQLDTLNTLLLIEDPSPQSKE